MSKSTKVIPVDVPYEKLCRLVAESSKYHKFEVEDILLHFVHVLQQEMQKCNTIAIRNFGKFWVQQSHVKERYCHLTKQQLPSGIQRRIRFAPAEETRRLVREQGKVQIDYEDETGEE